MDERKIKSYCNICYEPFFATPEEMVHSKGLCPKCRKVLEKIDELYEETKNN